MAATYECLDCDVIVEDPRALCNPTAVQILCSFGRSRAERREAICAPMRARVKRACEVCGRPTLDEALICEGTDF